MTVVFVCEHGSAESVVAAAHFNRLAAAAGLARRWATVAAASALAGRGCTSTSAPVRDGLTE